MFAIPMLGLRGRTPATPLRLKACALSGFLMTLLFVVLAIVPIVDVESRLMFGVKLSGLIVITNGIGVAIFSSESGK